MQGPASLVGTTRFVASRVGRARNVVTGARQLAIVAVLALAASGCAGEVVAPAATDAGDRATDVPTAALPDELEPTAAQTQLEKQGSAPILNFQDHDAACIDLTANGAEWAFIVATAPRAGNRVASGFHVRGCANVFEAAVAWRLVDGLDALLAEGFGMASCGTGCVGTFDLLIEYPPRDAPGIGYLEVFTDSPEDGRAIHVNRIALILE